MHIRGNACGRNLHASEQRFVDLVYCMENINYPRIFNVHDSYRDAAEEQKTAEIQDGTVMQADKEAN